MCLDLATNRIIISCHVTFDESCFPFEEHGTQPPSFDFDTLSDLEYMPLPVGTRFPAGTPNAPIDATSVSLSPAAPDGVLPQVFASGAQGGPSAILGADASPGSRVALSLSTPTGPVARDSGPPLGFLALSPSQADRASGSPFGPSGQPLGFPVSSPDRAARALGLLFGSFGFVAGASSSPRDPPLGSNGLASPFGLSSTPCAPPSIPARVPILPANAIPVAPVANEHRMVMHTKVGFH